MTIQDALNLYETGSGRLANWIDSLSIGGQVTVIGVAIVFAVLIILMFVLKIMEKIFAPKTVKTENKIEAVAPVVEEKKAPVVSSEETDEELIAVITAAIAASLNTSTYNLKIKSFRRVANNAPAWNKAGLNETINSRF